MPLRLSILREYILTVLLVLFYFSEAVNKYFIFLIGEEIFLSKLIKGSILIVVFFSILFQKNNKLNMLLLFTLVVFFVLGQFFLSPNFDKLVIINFTKYLFPLLLFIYLNEYKPSEQSTSLLVNIFERIVFINSLLVVLGLMFNVYFFKTYGGHRFGFNGLLVSSATSTYFYSIALFHYFVKYKKRVFYDFKRVIVITSVLIVGTKSLYLFLIFYFFIFADTYNDKKARHLIFFMLALFLLPLSYFLIFEFGVFSNISRKEGILASITSFRSDIFLHDTLPFIYNNWTLPNYFFGGINIISTRPQMAIIDLVYFFGIFGSLLYLFIYLNNYFSFKITKTERLFFVIIFLMSFIAGNFFINPTIVIYMAIIRESIKENLIYGLK